MVGKVKRDFWFQSFQKDLELLSFWLSNTHQLLNCLKQYSGEEVRRQHVPHPPPHPHLSSSSSSSPKEFMKQSSPRQKKNCLQNFDLSEHRQILSDLAIHIYHQFITVMEKDLAPAVGTVQT